VKIDNATKVLQDGSSAKIIPSWGPSLRVQCDKQRPLTVDVDGHGPAVADALAGPGSFRRPGGTPGQVTELT
jgi:hypothetical protein